MKSSPPNIFPNISSTLSPLVKNQLYCGIFYSDSPLGGILFSDVFFVAFSFQTSSLVVYFIQQFSFEFASLQLSSFTYHLAIALQKPRYGYLFPLHQTPSLTS